MSDDLRRAVAQLAKVAARRLHRHPSAHLADARRARLELHLELPITGSGDALEEATADAERQIAEEIETLLTRRAAFRPGHVYCLRCQDAGCAHGADSGPRTVFSGYGPSGLPRFTDFGQWLLERHHPQVDRLYREHNTLVTVVSSGRELAADLLPAFHDRDEDLRLHGQVAAGWFHLPGARDGENRFALSFQVVSALGRRGQRRLGLNLVGVGPDGTPLASIDRDRDETFWAPVATWAQSSLDSIERAQKRPEATAEGLSARIEGVLLSIARRLGRGRRAHTRRTGHAAKRHREGDRPTRMAVADLKRAEPHDVYRDHWKKTFVVLGERGRAHVFNPHGKLVTSIRYTPEAIARKKSSRRWRPADESQVTALKQAVSRRASSAPRDGT